MRVRNINYNRQWRCLFFLINLLGAGILVLETLSSAVKRNAKVYCELAGYGASCDAYHITSPDPNGDGLRRAILGCLRDSNIHLNEVQYINAHGTSTKKNDLFETIAYKNTFGEYASKLRISSIKVYLILCCYICN